MLLVLFNNLIMKLDSVWKKINTQIGFYTLDTFDNVPALPGVYGWFYPLKIQSKDLNHFISEINTVINYDVVRDGIPSRQIKLVFNWEEIELNAVVKNRVYRNLNSVLNNWNEIVDSDRFDDFRKIILKSSIYLPPLYVGKTNNLAKRCAQHRNPYNVLNNNFNNRFTNYMKKQCPSSIIKTVSDLIFVCITTDEMDGYTNDVEKLIETVLKNISKPPYSRI